MTGTTEPNHTVFGQAHLVLIARRADPAVLLDALEALAPAGLRVVEITLDTAGGLELISKIRSRISSLVVGAGTVFTKDELVQAQDAGAQFAVSPHGSATLAEAARTLNLPYVPGAYTPSEIVAAWEWGVPLVKVFPIVTLGTAYLRQLRGPLPHIGLVVTGGVTMDNALEYRRAGADAVGMGSELLRRWQTGTAADQQELAGQLAGLIAALER